MEQLTEREIGNDVETGVLLKGSIYTHIGLHL